MGLSACGWRDSRINPSNWGQGKSVPVDAPSEVNPLIPAERQGLFRRNKADEVDSSVLIASVTKLQIEQTPVGAIILAEGLASRQGAYDAELRPVQGDTDAADGVLHLEFRVNYPVVNTPVGSERTRQVVEAYSVTTQQMRDVRQVQVRGAQNAMESRRR
ncbi:hypothetical protein I5535_19400 [Rhodobacteraceae bacterium F11138]|nr:hypothetical protein [Rhodobacteraceae bacterium F11138]